VVKLDPGYFLFTPLGWRKIANRKSQITNHKSQRAESREQRAEKLVEGTAWLDGFSF
jgi:hypothetical protein